MIYKYLRPAFVYFFLAPQLCAQIPNGYYANADGKSGATLKTALYNIIKNPSVTSYAGLYTSFLTTDRKPNGKVWDMYSDIPGGTPPYEYSYGTGTCGNYAQEGDCYNREHSFPQSWFSSASPMQSDLFHLYPTDGTVNGIRSNFPFGEVGTASKTTQNGSKLGASKSPGYASTVFEPIDEYKGDLARGVLYMVTCYENQVVAWQGNGNANNILSGNTFPALDQWHIDLLAKWHQQDPVSSKEINRNNAAYAVQNNRNPFIDHPQYAGLIWGFGSVTGVNTTPGVVTTPGVNTSVGTNIAPKAFDFTYFSNKNVAFIGSINTLYSDLNNDVLTLQSFTGTLTGGSNFLLNANGTFTFIPQPGFTGLESFTYTVCDPATCTSAVINFDVKPINKAPLATSQTFLVAKNLAFSASINDLYSDSDVLTLQPFIGTLTGGSNLLLNANGSFTFIPKPGFTGSESFIYTVCDLSTCTSALLNFSVSGTAMANTADKISDNFLIYPQPAIDLLHIYSNAVAIRSLVLYNTVGIKLWEQQTENAEIFAIPTSGLVPGSYVLIINTEQLVVAKKIFISK